MGPMGPPGPTAVSTDVGQLAKLGTDSLLLVSSDDVATPDADLAAFTSGLATLGQVPTADGAGGVDWVDPAGAAAEERRFEADTPYCYLGTAPAGTLDADEAWAITRVDFPAGMVELSATDVAWDDRATVTYT